MRTSGKTIDDKIPGAARRCIATRGDSILSYTDVSAGIAVLLARATRNPAHSRQPTRAAVARLTGARV